MEIVVKKSKKIIRYLIKTTVTIFVVVCVAVLFLYQQNNDIKTYNYSVEMSEIPASFDGYRICLLSDLHEKEFGKENKTLIKKIKEYNPDVILCSGDMVNSLGDGQVFLRLSQILITIAPVYYVDGNHEQSLTFQAQSKKSEYLDGLNYYDSLKKVGVKVINDKKVTLTKGNEHINLYGLVLPMSQYSIEAEKPEYKVKNLVNSFGKSERNDFNILIAHQPREFEVYEQWGADLVFAGHVHGGMINIPFKGGLLSPEREFFPYYYGGRYEKNDSIMIISRGLGSSGFKQRIFNRPELSIIDLKRG